MAPEILQSHKYDAKADLWSVGTILYELVVGRPPFNGSNHVALLHNIERHEAKIPDQIARSLSPACIDLIYSLLKRNPVQRMSFEEFFSHPFLAAATPLAAAVQGEAPPPDTSIHQSGGSLLCSYDHGSMSVCVMLVIGATPLAALCIAGRLRLTLAYITQVGPIVLI